MFSLKGRAALITGGTQGVGAAIAKALASAGADVILHGLAPNEESAKTLAACRAMGVRTEVIFSDLCQDMPNGLQQLCNSSLRLLPTLDLLVNNAGTYIDPPFLETTFENFDRTMKLNVYAGFFLTQAFAQHWVANGIAGRVLFTGSINGILAEQDHVGYDASKGAVAAMVRSLCVALAPQGIRVNSMAPGLVRTPLTNQVLSRDADVLNWMKLHTPNGEVPDAEVCGGTAVFLLSDEAAHIHGQTILVDGGMGAWQQPDLPAYLRGHLPG
jgi:NAD(P)-dependent dehydrogenase (short-subunit alcohol dehydrogenase family)